MNPDWSLEPLALTELTSEALHRILEFRRRGDLGTLEAFAGECQDVLASFDDKWAKACAPSEPEPSAGLIRYALVSLIDESVASSSWEHRREWENHSLEIQCFGTDRRGKDFYLRLDRQLKSPDAQPAVLLAYYTCLLIGFRGQYWHDEPSREAVMNELRERLSAPDRVDLAELSSPVKHDENPPSRLGGMSTLIQRASLGVGAVIAAIYTILQWRY